MSDALPFEIDVLTLKKYQDDNHDHVVLDVREPAEIASHAFEGALEIPMNEVPQDIDSIPKNKTVVVMCHLGGRSMQVTGWLRQQGYENVTNLRGGIEAWSQM
ncbi:Thiosulfate sulfurtransferase [Candidatus Terasakiella magnetica]|uniref:Thiosulfate sulfurtransferase n=1 Tax=Candidatus Terasakiella magnetica TaxID=1867952 RepID=A0A1C3RL62_9PROT|nr:rhodanese-like domain-containing protein [Candidatus Terasakiella magnetica]SCA58015.1 Thiosulfate sulfurtransferase [Candidatus Terasakiella magnetica]